MKKLKVTDHALCHTCLQCVVACSTAFYKEFHQDKSCIALGEKKDGSTMVKTCIQCGKCARACEAGAIKQNAKGVYMIDKKLCTKCGKCAEVCPFGVLVKVDEESFPTKCIACGICAKECPMGILEVVES